MRIELRPCRLYLPGGLLGKRKKRQEVHHSPRFCLWGTLPVAFTSAGVNVDDPFFPETKGDRTDRWAENLDDDNVCQETFSKIYQDTNLPFRPNTSGYDGEQRNLAEYEFREPSNPSESKREHNFFWTDDGCYDTSSDGPKNDSISENKFPVSTPTDRDPTLHVLFSISDMRICLQTRAQNRIWEMHGFRWRNKIATNWLQVHNRQWESRSPASGKCCNAALQNDAGSVRHFGVAPKDGN